MKENKVFDKLLSIYRPFWGRFTISWLFVASSTALAMISPYSVGRIIDSANNKDFYNAYLWAILGIATMFLSRPVFRCAQYIYEIKKIDYDVERVFKRSGLVKMNELSVGQHINQNSGIKQDVVSSGCDSLLQLNQLLLFNISFMILHALVGLSFLLFTNLVIALLTASSITIYIALSLWFNKKNGKSLDKMVKKYNSSQKRYTDYIRNIPLLLLNSNEEVGLDNYDKIREDYENYGKEFWIRCIKFFNFGNAIVVMNSGLVVLYCIYLNSSGRISLGEIPIYMFWVNITTGFLDNFNSTIRHLMRLNARIKKFLHFLDIEPDIRKPTDEIELRDFSGAIEFQDVSFSYPELSYFQDFEEHDEEDDAEDKGNENPDDRGPVLKNLSFKINPREKVAFVGHSGTGKSTLISLLLRAYAPQSGKILLDGIDMDRLDPKKFRKMIGLVEQDIQLMDDTIRQNLIIGMNGRSSSISDAELWKAMETANLADLGKRLKKGLDTNIGERGIKLSGGEKQRLAIARALLKKAPLIVFDEATSSLDSINEYEIHEAMAKASENTTCIFIAHRLATVKNVDRIFVMEEGRIISVGKHAELLENCETYRKLVEKQVVAF